MQRFTRSLARASLALLAGTLAAGAAVAQNDEWQNRYELERARQAQREELHRRADANRPDWSYRHDYDTHRRAEEWRRGHGPDYRHDDHAPRWARGEHYRGGRSDWLDNPARYRLRPAPRGTHWVRADRDHFLLVGDQSGRILEVVRR